MAGIGAVASGLTSAMGLIQSLDSAYDTVQSFGTNEEEEYRKALKAEQNLALKQLQAKQALTQSSLEADVAQEKAELLLEKQQTESARLKALKRAVAKQRANFAGQGISSSGGSSEAVLLGLFEDSEDDQETSDTLSALKTKALESSLAENKALNVLQRTQLLEKQALEREIQGF